MKKISDIGERKLIYTISSIVSADDDRFVGIGDDTAAFRLDDENYLLMSTDMINEKTHIPKDMTPWQIGWFVVAINLSDIAAKGGRPIGILLSFGLPRDYSEKDFVELVKGAEACARKYDTFIAGGDTKENPSVTINGTVFGMVKQNEFMSRKGCKAGDIVLVTGFLGKAAAGFYSLKKTKSLSETSKLLLEPKPRVNEGRFFANQKIVTSCMDLSDGLSSSLYQLKSLNDVGFEIYKDKIPVSKNLFKVSDEINFDVYEKVLHFGGDYELVLTIPADKKHGFFEKCKKKNIFITEIGKVISEKQVFIKDNNREILENKGYEHFR